MLPPFVVPAAWVFYVGMHPNDAKISVARFYTLK